MSPRQKDIKNNKEIVIIKTFVQNALKEFQKQIAICKSKENGEEYRQFLTLIAKNYFEASITDTICCDVATLVDNAISSFFNKYDLPHKKSCLYEANKFIYHICQALTDVTKNSTIAKTTIVKIQQNDATVGLDKYCELVKFFTGSMNVLFEDSVAQEKNMLEKFEGYYVVAYYGNVKFIHNIFSDVHNGHDVNSDLADREIKRGFRMYILKLTLSSSGKYLVAESFTKYSDAPHDTSFSEVSENAKIESISTLIEEIRKGNIDDLFLKWKKSRSNDYLQGVAYVDKIRDSIMVDLKHLNNENRRDRYLVIKPDNIRRINDMVHKTYFFDTSRVIFVKGSHLGEDVPRVLRRAACLKCTSSLMKRNVDEIIVIMKEAIAKMHIFVS